MARLGFFLTLLPRLEPPSEELHQTGTFQTLYRLSYSATAALTKDVSSSSGKRIKQPTENLSNEHQQKSGVFGSSSTPPSHESLKPKRTASRK